MSEIRRNSRAKRKRMRRICNTVIITTLILVIAIACICLLSSLLKSKGPDNSGMTGAESSSASPTESTTPTETTPRDTVAPELVGVHDFVIYQGDTISYYSGISATDDEDPNPTITVDNSAVDLSKEGEYQAIYICKDAAGNETRVVATVTVLQKKEGYADLETIYAEVDAKLAQIVKEDMTDRQKVEAIYIWARSSLGYSDHFDHNDYRQAAYLMLTKNSGDCYGYFAVTKLMFERLGIPNIDVQKVKNYEEDSNHYWSLVSVDGGQTWYHFDATPRKGSGDDFCLVTDAFLDAYSDAHKKCHNRDKSLYPATP